MFNGGFGPAESIPESLRGESIELKSPTRDAEEKALGQVFVEGAALVREAMALDPSSGTIPNAVEALRGALKGIGWQEAWMRSREDSAAMAANEAQQAATEKMMGMMQQGAATAVDLSKAAAT
jgi:hypothetical protein